MSQCSHGRASAHVGGQNLPASDVIYHLHTAWDFTQGNIFGFSVAGQSLSGSASFFSLRQGGPELWTGGVIGPDGGFLSICAFLLGVIALVCYIRWRYGKIAFSPSLTRFQRRETKKTEARIDRSIVPDEDDVSDAHSSF